MSMTSRLRKCRCVRAIRIQDGLIGGINRPYSLLGSACIIQRLTRHWGHLFLHLLLLPLDLALDLEEGEEPFSVDATPHIQISVRSLQFPSALLIQGGISRPIMLLWYLSLENTVRDRTLSVHWRDIRASGKLHRDKQ